MTMVKMELVQDLLDREMTRMEFFQLAGAGLLAIVGVTGLLNNLSSISTKRSGSGMGYGGSTYGR